MDFSGKIKAHVIEFIPITPKYCFRQHTFFAIRVYLIKVGRTEHPPPTPLSGVSVGLFVTSLWRLIKDNTTVREFKLQYFVAF